VRVVGIDGRSYTWDLRGRMPTADDDRSRSNLHLRARALLSQLFPLDIRAEEVPIPGTQGLTADFVLPSRLLIVEVQGQQHYKHITHFHEFPVDYWAARARDQRKVEWCELNGWRCICLPHFCTDHEWVGLLS
jgi:very-short-patch-repair endonuclease